MQQNHPRWNWLVVTAVLAVACPVEAAPIIAPFECQGGDLGDDCSLAEWLAGGVNIGLGDKFANGGSVLGNGGIGLPNPPDLTKIRVTPLLNPGSNPGLRFTDTGDAWRIDNTTGTSDKSLLTSFDFAVSVNNPFGDVFIKDNSLTLVDVGDGLRGFGSEVFIRETVSGVSTPKTVFRRLTRTGVEERRIDERTFTPTVMLDVRIDVQALAVAGGFAELNEFEVRFSQTSVPEPPTALLACVGLMMARWRQLSQFVLMRVRWRGESQALS